MPTLKVPRRFWLICLTAAITATGCSSKITGPQTQQTIVRDTLIKASIRPGLPQDSSSSSTSDSAQTGDDTLMIQVFDSISNDPIPDANVTAAPYTDLIDQQRAESGRSQGNGIFLVPIRFGVPDTYKVSVDVQRPGEKFPVIAQFHFTVN